jgi:hypothetical protein
MRSQFLLRRLAVGGWLISAAASPLCLLAQDSLPPWQGGITASLGQPSRTGLYTGGSLGYDWRQGQSSSLVLYGVLGVNREIGNPIAAPLAASLEAYGGMGGEDPDGGIRALFQVIPFHLSIGVDYRIPDNRAGLLLGVTSAVRRGGVFGAGTLLRFEWNAGSLGAARASVLVPLGQPLAGHTRPRASRVDVPIRSGASPEPPPEADRLEPALANVRGAATRIEQLVVPYLDYPGADPRAALAPLLAELRASPSLPGVDGPGMQTEAVVRAYHAELDRAFSMATSNQPLPVGATTPEGLLAAASARAMLRDHVLYPYNRLLGQWRTKTAFAGLAAHARGNFARSVASIPSLSAERDAAILYVFDQVLDAIAGIERGADRQWGDDRVVWLPLQLGLRPEDHDTQAELDAIIEAAVGVRFTNGNRVTYVVNDEFQEEVIRSINRARDYHVLWIHDFRGLNDQGLPDASSLRFVVDAYLRALIQRVREYDVRKRIPVFMIFLDEHYYRVNRGRLWLDLLEDPRGAVPRLPPGFEASATAIQAAQEELREAIAGSRLLQVEARQYGEQWLRNVVRVQINVTNPPDQSFWSNQALPLVGMSDNWMRDHRKIVFYDISEDDPYRGEAIYTGMGVGEHYAGPTWEDRALIVQGPAVLSLKAQARQLLESQGIAGDRIPYPLRARQLGPGYQLAIEAEKDSNRVHGRRDQRALELHNLTGFQSKQVNVAKATLFSLMPRGAVLKVPDSLWGSALYASLLTGSALRGCRVLFVAPSLAAAPSGAPPQMAVAHDLFARLIVLQQEFGPDLEAAGGMLKTGIYNPGIGVQDATARFFAAYTNARRTPFLRRLFPLDSTVDSMLVHVRDLAGMPMGGIKPPGEIMPKLHLKANFFASQEGWDRLVARPEMAGVLEAYLGQLLAPSVGATGPSEALTAASENLEANFSAALSPEDRERLVYFLMIGSTNQDYRSMFMDGEASVLLSGWSGVVSLVDFGLIITLSVWIDDLEMLDALLPPPPGVLRGVSRHLRPLM